MSVPVEEAIAALSTFSLEDDQPDLQGLAVLLSTERCATNSPIEYGDVSAYRLSLTEDTKSINLMNTLIQEGKEMASVLYTYRSCVKALPQLPDSMKHKQADLYLETYQVLDLEMSRLREIQRWQASAATKLAADMQRFSRPERLINGPTITHFWSMLKLLDVLLQLDHLKNAKASIPNDFSWYKRTFTQVSAQWQDTDSLREELDDLQIFLSTRWAILLNLHAEMFRSNTVEDILQVLVVFCVESLELDFALLFPERHTLLRVLPVLVVLATSSEKDGESLYKRVKINRLINIFKNDPVIPAFPDLHLSSASILKELSMYFQNFSSQTRLLTLPSPHELPPREIQDYQRHYLLLNHIEAIRAEHDDFSIRFSSSVNQIVLLRSADGADLEWSREVKGNMYDMVVEGFQLLSRWTGRIWEQCAWKFSRPCKDVPSLESQENSTTFFDYEKVVRWNYTPEERKALLEVISYVKSIGSMMQRCDTLVADALLETIHAEVQDFVQDKLDAMLRTSFRKKKDLSRILSDMRTLSADWMANTSKPEPELLSLPHVTEESKGNSFYPRPVAPTAAQVHCLQFLICELVSGGNLRKPGGLFGNSGSGISVEDLKQLETFFYKLSFFLHILDFTATISALTDLGFLWFREFYLESSRVIQFPIECSLPWMLVDHVTESQDAGLLESILMPFDIYNDSAQHALTVLKQRFLYDEIEAEADLCFDQLAFKLSENIFAYYKSWAARKLLDQYFLSTTDNGDSYAIQPMRFTEIYKLTRVKLLGRTIDLRRLIIQRMNKLFRDNIDVLFEHFENQDLCAIVELQQLLDILELTHQLLSRDLLLDSFTLMLNEMQENLSFVSFSSRLSSQIWTEMQNDFLPNFILCNTTQRFVRSTKGTFHSIQKPAAAAVKSFYYCGSQELNMAYQSLSVLYSEFFGIPHMFAIVKLLGSRSLPWLVRTLLDHISNKISAIVLKVTGLQEALPKSIGLLPFDGGISGCQRIIHEQLTWGTRSDLKMDILHGLKEIGSTLYWMGLLDIVMMGPKKVISEDIGWQHGEPHGGSRHNYKCNYCGFEGKGGGVSRLKKHLAGGRLAGYNDVQGCKQVPPEIKKLMLDHLKQTQAENAKKKADRELAERIISGREQDEDNPDEPEMFPDYEVQERRARQMSRAEAWEADQRAAHRSSFEAGNYEAGGGSGSGSVAGGGTQPHRYSSVEDYFTRPPVPEQPRQQARQRKRGTGVEIEEVDPQVYSREHGKQTRMEDAYNPKGPRYKIGKALAKWWHHAGMSFNAAESPYYKPAIQEVQRQGLHVQPPSAKELAGRYLQEEVDELRTYIEGFKKKWEKYGCTLMCDGWSGTTRSSLINFLVYCDRQVFYHRSVDASDEVHNHQYILSLMTEVVEEIGEQYIVQVVTDNGSAYKKAGEELMEIYPHLYWTPCAAHCVDLMLKEIGTESVVEKVVEAAQKITKFIYNHHMVLAWMRESCGGELLRPAVTRFATNFVALQSLLKHKDGLKDMFRGRKWLKSSFAGKFEGKEVEELVNSANFWDRVYKLVQIIEPLYEVLRVVDGERQPTIGLVYAKLEEAKTKIEEASPRYANLVLDVVKERWDRQMSRDLHMAAYYLHPAYHYKHELAYKDELTAAFTRVANRIARSPTEAADAIDQMKTFREAVGTFADPSAIAGRDRVEGADWWFNFGYSAPTLRTLAIKILSQTASSSGCERNWSTFALIHSKVRNRLTFRRLDNLVYVHYNMRLRVKHLVNDPKQRGEVEYDPLDTSFVRDEEDPMVSWVARSTTERGGYELDEEADDPEDPPRPNTFLKQVVEELLAEEEREAAQLQRSQSSRPRVRQDDEVDLLGEIQMGGSGERDKGAQIDDDAEFERLMQGPVQRSQSLREPIPRRTLGLGRGRGKGKEVAQPSQTRQKGAPSSRGARKGIVIEERQESAQATQPQKKKGWFSGWRSKKGKKDTAPPTDPLDIADAETLDPNASDDTPTPSGSPKLPSSKSHDSMTTGSPGGSEGGGNQGQGGGGGGGVHFTEEQHFDHATQDDDHGARPPSARPADDRYSRQYKRSTRGAGGSSAYDSARDSDAYNTMLSDFERMSTQESVGSYGGPYYQPESTGTGYGSGYGSGYDSGYGPYGQYTAIGVPTAYTTPAPYMTMEDVYMAQLNVVRPGSQLWETYVTNFLERYHTMMTWEEFRNFITHRHGVHLIGDLPAELVPPPPQWSHLNPPNFQFR